MKEIIANPETVKAEAMQAADLYNRLNMSEVELRQPGSTAGLPDFGFEDSQSLVLAKCSDQSCNKIRDLELAIEEIRINSTIESLPLSEQKALRLSIIEHSTKQGYGEETIRLARGFGRHELAAQFERVNSLRSEVY